MIHCSGKNVIFPNPGKGWEAHSVNITGTVNFSGDGAFKVNGDITLHDYPPLNCGNITYVEYLGEVSEY